MPTKKKPSRSVPPGRESSGNAADKKKPSPGGVAGKKKASAGGIEFHPVDVRRWPDMVELFGERGACAGCWCMWWRGSRADFKKNQGDGNKRRMKRLIESGVVPGILAYHAGRPVGWCSVGPRESYDALERSRVLKRIDDNPVWSIVCFFIANSYRRKGLSVRLIRAAAKYARSRGAKIVEGYPVVAREGYPAAWAYPGFETAFKKAGFSVAKRWSKARPIMRFPVSPPPGT